MLFVIVTRFEEWSLVLGIDLEKSRESSAKIAYSSVCPYIMNFPLKLGIYTCSLYVPFSIKIV